MHTQRDSDTTHNKVGMTQDHIDITMSEWHKCRGIFR